MKKMMTMCFGLVAVMGYAFPTAIAGYPESVAEEDDVYYVANIGQSLAPMDQDGDGCILKLNWRGKILSTNAFPGVALDAPKGLLIEDDVLYCADVNRVVGIDLRTGTQRVVFDLSKTGARFLNDLVEEDGFLYVSATDIHAIFAINLRTGTYEQLQTATPIDAPNGMDIEDGVLYVAEYSNREGKPLGRIVSMPLVSASPRPVTVVYAAQGALDGLQVEDEDRWFGRPDDSVVYFSEWGADGKSGAVKKYNLRTREVEVLNDEPIFGPADFILEDGRVVVPAMGEKRVMRF